MDNGNPYLDVGLFCLPEVVRKRSWLVLLPDHLGRVMQNRAKKENLYVFNKDAKKANVVFKTKLKLPLSSEISSNLLIYFMLTLNYKRIYVGLT